MSRPPAVDLVDATVSGPSPDRSLRITVHCHPDVVVRGLGSTDTDLGVGA